MNVKEALKGLISALMPSDEDFAKTLNESDVPMIEKAAAEHQAKRAMAVIARDHGLPFCLDFFGKLAEVAAMELENGHEGRESQCAFCDGKRSDHFMTVGQLMQAGKHFRAPDFDVDEVIEAIDKDVARQQMFLEAAKSRPAPVEEPKEQASAESTPETKEPVAQGS